MASVLTEIFTPLGVAEDHEVTAEFAEHGRAGFAGVGTVVLKMDVLGSDFHGTAWLARRECGGKGDEWRTNGRIHSLG
jgi:hypothetical protein